jgi:hypothetical protein
MANGFAAVSRTIARFDITSQPDWISHGALRPIVWLKHESWVHGLITVHLPIGPVFEIADRQLFEEWIGIDELFTRGPAGRVGTRHQ